MSVVWQVSGSKVRDLDKQTRKIRGTKIRTLYEVVSPTWQIIMSIVIFIDFLMWDSSYIKPLSRLDNVDFGPSLTLLDTQPKLCQKMWRHVICAIFFLATVRTGKYGSSLCRCLKWSTSVVIIVITSLWSGIEVSPSSFVVVSFWIQSHFSEDSQSFSLDFHIFLISYKTWTCYSNSNLAAGRSLGIIRPQIRNVLHLLLCSSAGSC